MDTEAGEGAEDIHIANCGGTWQALILGFAGMGWAYESTGRHFTPRLPRHWHALEFPMCHGGRGDRSGEARRKCAPEESVAQRAE